MELVESSIIYDGVSPPAAAEIFDKEIIEEKIIAVLDSTITSPDVCQLVNSDCRASYVIAVVETP